MLIKKHCWGAVILETVVIADIKSQISDGEIIGHYVAVANNYNDVLKEDYNVQIAGGPTYSKYFTDAILLKHDTESGKGKIRNQIFALQNAFEVIKKVKKDILIFQHNGMMSILFALLTSKVKCKVFLIQYYDTVNERGIFSRWLFNAVKKKITGILCPGNSVGKIFDMPYCVVPDFFYKKNISSNSIELPQDIDFGFYGVVSYDKGVLEAVRRLGQYDCSIVVAGRAGKLDIDKEMIAELLEYAKKNRRIVVDLRFLSTNEYESYIKRTRYCVLNYSGVYMNRSSGVIFDALYARKPVLVKRRDLTKFVEEWNLGFAYDSIDEVNFDFIMRDDVYRKYQENIEIYLTEQERQIEKLIQFIKEG